MDDNILIALTAYRHSLPATSVLTVQERSDDRFPLLQVLRYYQEVGKHFVDQNVRQELEYI